MRFAAVGQRYVWFFNAPDETEGRKIANTCLFFEKLGADTCLSGFSRDKGYWKAVPEKVDNETIKLTGKVVEIKRRRPPNIDVIYLTRMQKERWSSQDHT